MIGSVVLVVLLIALLGFLVYLITENVPMPPMFKQLIIVASVVFVVLYIIGLVMGSITLPALKSPF